MQMGQVRGSARSLFAVRGALLAAVLASAALLFGCRGAEAPPADGRLETVEVAPPLDVELTTTGDPRAPERRAAVSGVLPAGFPRDLPLPLPSTLIDFGDAGGGWGYVALASPDPPPTVERGWRSRLEAAGWAPAGSQAGLRVYRNAGREVRVGIRAQPPGSEVRIEYPLG